MLTLARKVKIRNEIHLDPHFRKLHMEIWIKLVETKRVPLLTQHDDVSRSMALKIPPKDG